MIPYKKAKRVTKLIQEAHKSLQYDATTVDHCTPAFAILLNALADACIASLRFETWVASNPQPKPKAKR